MSIKEMRFDVDCFVSWGEPFWKQDVCKEGYFLPCDLLKEYILSLQGDNTPEQIIELLLEGLE